MIQKDYILRWVQELAKVMARMIGKDPKETLELLDTAFDELLQLDAKSLRDIPKEKIIDYLIKERGFDIPQLEFIAELLYLQATNMEALLAQSGDFADQRDKLEKALIIFEHVENNQDIFSLERQDKLAKIRSTLKEL